MSRWFTLTADYLKAAGHGTLIDTARTRAVGAVDPVAEAIANATARILRAIAPNNALDADPTKIPGSMKGIAEKICIYDLRERIGLPLSPDQSEKLRGINSELNRMTDNKTKVELPDTPQPTPTMQSAGIQVGAIRVPKRLTGRGRQSGL